MKKTIILATALVLIMTGCALKGGNTAKILKAEEVKAKALDYINTQLLTGGNKATIDEVSEESGLYKLKLTVSGKQYDSYASKDGSKFFVEALDMSAKPAAETGNSAPTVQTVNTKQAKPTVEVFVMSHCPYGTQIEKGVIPVAKILGDKINFSIKFCDYAMHGEKELDEETNQYCINKEEPSKYLSYLECFLDNGDTAACLKTAGINQAKNKSCLAATEKKYQIKKKFADKTTWINNTYPTFDIYKAENEKYGVSGSPTLVINGEKISSARDSASLLATICSGFENQPGECQAQLSSSTPSAGFGYGEGGAATDATCN
jgi:hypothetical protein